MSTRLEIQTAWFVLDVDRQKKKSCSNDLDEMTTVAIQGVGGSFLLLEQTDALLFV